TEWKDAPRRARAAACHGLRQEPAQSLGQLMARYSRTTGRWTGSRYQRAPDPDGYLPSSPGYTERHRQTAIELSDGLTRIDLGEPVKAPGRVFKRPACEARPVSERVEIFDAPVSELADIVPISAAAPQDDPQRPKRKPRRSAFSED